MGLVSIKSICKRIRRLLIVSHSKLQASSRSDLHRERERVKEGTKFNLFNVWPDNKKCDPVIRNHTEISRMISRIKPNFWKIRTCLLNLNAFFCTAMFYLICCINLNAGHSPQRWKRELKQRHEIHMLWIEHMNNTAKQVKIRIRNVYRVALPHLKWCCPVLTVQQL